MSTKITNTPVAPRPTPSATPTSSPIQQLEQEFAKVAHDAFSALKKELGSLLSGASKTQAAPAAKDIGLQTAPALGSTSMRSESSKVA